jgi:hypothetical protein
MDAALRKLDDPFGNEPFRRVVLSRSQKLVEAVSATGGKRAGSLLH